jgi:arabinoxylan arabinofuranohydrolase
MNMKKTSIIFIVLTCLSLEGLSNWIIFSQRYTADPAVIVYNGRVYVYASHDTDDQPQFLMDGYTCFSSDDLLNWTDHGEVAMAKDIPYINDMNFGPHFWAPEAIERNGKFYLYYCIPDRDGKNLDSTGTGVLVADSPIGPFKDARGNLLLTGHKVDVGVMIDDDGQAYAYWPNGPTKKLKDNMYEFEDGEWDTGTNDTHEAPFVRKINGKYYYMYMTFNDKELWACSDHNQPPDGCGDFFYDGDYYHKYHFLDEPTGTAVEPNSPHGRTMMWPVVGDNTQMGVFEFAGNYYSLYHSKTLARSRGVRGYQRNVGLDRLYFNADGTLVPQTITEEGLKQVKYLNPYIRQEAETIGREHSIETEPCTDEGGGRKVSHIDHNDWIRMHGVDFGTGATTIEVRVAAEKAFGKIEIRLDEVDGTLVGTIDVPETGGKTNWQTISTNLNGATGVHDMYFIFKDGGFDFNWWQCKGGRPSNAIPPKVIKPVSLRLLDRSEFVEVTENGLASGDLVINEQARFELIDNEDGSYSLYAVDKRKFVTCNGVLKVTKDAIEGDAEKFLLQHTPNGSYCLYSLSENKYIYAPKQTGNLQTGSTQPWKEENKTEYQFRIEYLDHVSTINKN